MAIADSGAADDARSHGRAGTRPRGPRPGSASREGAPAAPNLSPDGSYLRFLDDEYDRELEELERHIPDIVFDEHGHPITEEIGWIPTEDELLEQRFPMAPIDEYEAEIDGLRRGS